MATRPASSDRVSVPQSPIYVLRTRSPKPSGSWRLLLLEPKLYPLMMLTDDSSRDYSQCLKPRKLHLFLRGGSIRGDVVLLIEGLTEMHANVYAIGDTGQRNRLICCTYEVELECDGHVCDGPLHGLTGPINSVAFSPNGTLVASSAREHVIMLWSVRAGDDVPKPFTGHTSGVNSVTFSPDGLHIASGSSDRTVRVWDVRSDSLVINIFNGHADSVESVAFSSGGHRIASDSRDAVVLLWDTYTGDIIASLLMGHNRIMYAQVAFSPDGSRIASGYTDGSIRVWSAQANGAAIPTTWDNYAAPQSDTTSATSAVTNTQAYHLPPGTAPIMGSALPQQEGICTITEVVRHSTLNNDGWLLLDSAPVIWVPLELHSYLPYPHSALAIGPQGSMYFADESLLLGESWGQCFVSE